MTTDLGMQCAEVPLIELLRGIPNDARLTWTEPDGLKATHFVPVGIYAHRAADEIERLRERIAWFENYVMACDNEAKRANQRRVEVALELDAALSQLQGQKDEIERLRGAFRHLVDTFGDEDPIEDIVSYVLAILAGGAVKHPDVSPVLDHRFLPDGMDPGICQKCGSTRASHRDAPTRPR